MREMKGLSREEAKACVGPGWATLIDRFYEHVDRNDHLYHDMRVVQVKEKYGTLNIYFFGGDEFLEGISWALKWWSGTICEECGALGKPNPYRGWVKTQCREHWDAQMKEYDYVESEYDEPQT